jgi:hypothetical protein
MRKRSHQLGIKHLPRCFDDELGRLAMRPAGLVHARADQRIVHIRQMDHASLDRDGLSAGATVALRREPQQWLWWVAIVLAVGSCAAVLAVGLPSLVVGPC